MTGVAHALTPRVVRVVVSIESQSFREGLGEARCRQFESKLASDVADALRQQFPVVDWSATDGGGEPAGRLIAAVTERQPQSLPAGVEPEVNLEWRAEIGGQPLNMPSVFPELLYSSTTIDRPLHDEDGKFFALLTQKIVGWAQSDTNHIKTEFLKYVPVATSVLVQPGQQVVVIPVPWKQSRLGEKSVFLVSYVDGIANPREQTHVMLSGLARRLSDPLEGSTQSHLSDCTRGGATINPAQQWQTCLDPLNANPSRNVSVRVDDYIYDANPGVSNGIVTDPY